MTIVPDKWRAPARWAGVVVVLGLFYALAQFSARDKSITFDELAHLTAGYTYDAFGDFRLHPENGNWPQRWAALPTAIRGANFPAFGDPDWRGAVIWNVGDKFLFGSGNDARAIAARGRAMIGGLGIALGLLVFTWSRKVTSELGAWISLTLFAFSPTLLAHDAAATSDMSAALFFVAATWCLWTLLYRMAPATVAVSALVTAGLFLSKYSAVIIVPIAGAMVLVRAFDRQPLMVQAGTRRLELKTRVSQGLAVLAAGAVHVLVVGTLIWVSYGFRGSAFAAGTSSADHFMVAWDSLRPQVPALAMTFIDWARAHSLLPDAYLYGLTHTLGFAAARPSFLNGEFSPTGSPWFFPYAFFAKSTIPELLLAVTAAAAAIAGRRRRAAPSASVTPLITLIAVYGVFALTSTLNIGHRHLLPIYPALFILAGRSAYWVERLTRRDAPVPAQADIKRGRKRPKASAPAPAVALGAAAKVAAGVVVALVAWQPVEALRIRPDYLAYFNPLAGGPANGYRHLVDSSLDWGQDLPGLAQWLSEHHAGPGSSTPVYLSYFGSARPSYYGVQTRALPSFLDRRTSVQSAPLTGGYYCISATMLQSVYLVAPASWTQAFEGAYQDTLAGVRAWDASAGDPIARARLIAERGEAYWNQIATYWDQLRLARLNARLRQMEPQARIGYSIFVYRLTDQQVNDALFGPPPY